MFFRKVLMISYLAAIPDTIKENLNLFLSIVKLKFERLYYGFMVTYTSQ